MIKPINTALLSYGMSGKIFHAPFLTTHKGFDLKAVVERTSQKAHLDISNLKSYSTVEELLADPEIELVVVNTPTGTHFDYALQALEAGKQVLLEKAFTVTSSEAKILFDKAKKLGLTLLAYQNRRYDSDFLSVKDVIQSGKLGRIVEVHFRYDRFRDTIGPKVAKETPGPGSGLMYDLGPHLLDAVLSIFGQPIHFTKTLGHFRTNTQVDDYAHFHLIFPNELQVFLTTSMLVVDAQPAFVLHGTKGSYVKQRSDVQENQLLDGLSPNHPQYGFEELGKEGLLTTITGGGVVTQEKIAAKKASYLDLFEAVYQTIRMGKPYPITQEQIIQQLEILETNSFNQP